MAQLVARCAKAGPAERRMTSWSEPLDVERLADGEADVDFAVPLAELSGLRVLRAGLGGGVQGRAHFAREEGVPVADLDFRGTVSLQCQRCLQPIERPLEAESHIAFVAAEAAAGGVPLEREPVLAPGGRISIAELLTEELLLLLPIVPLHAERERCVSERETERAPHGETQRPFANLADLLKR